MWLYVLLVLLWFNTAIWMTIALWDEDKGVGNVFLDFVIAVVLAPFTIILVFAFWIASSVEDKKE